MQQICIHSLQHVPFEEAGMIKEWITEHNFSHTITHLYKEDDLPDIDDIDCLVVLGGPMSVNDEEELVWLKKEKAFIKQAIEKNKTVIGICLGAQLIADVLGAKVYKNREKEIGWFSLNLTVIPNTSSVTLSAAKHLDKASRLQKLLGNQTVFHWHGETFDLPENTLLLASTEACNHQAFLYKEKVLGLQFHIEMNETSINNIIENCRDELKESTYIQSEEYIKQEMKDHVNRNRKLLFELLNIFKP